eukprot:Clim_evm7s215 gene=Clim_evmTU7s215
MGTFRRYQYPEAATSAGVKMPWRLRYDIMQMETGRAATVILVLGVIFHLVYVCSIFDIYFTSPIVQHGIQPVPNDLGIPEPPAKRLVLFVADGLRADKFFEGGPHTDAGVGGRAPFLRDIVLRKGTWGVSHTRVPTESRPGHVALIAGFYEDVSAVTRGWSENPVEFDSVFNETTHTYSWGSPDILPMFQKGAAPGRVEAFMYPPHFEDFAQYDNADLDRWVFDMVTEFLETAEEARIIQDKVPRPNSKMTLVEELDQDGIIFFFHLLGIDSNGHAYRPNSVEYLSNIEVVDEGIRRMVRMVEEYYNYDGRTAYIFTADHGMSHRGSHGDGSADETMTPLVAWGAGVAVQGVSPGLQDDEEEAGTADDDERRSSNSRIPEASVSRGAGKSMYESQQLHKDRDGDGLIDAWGLAERMRRDVEQADIAPLMSTLLGIPIPMHSVGVLPMDYLDLGPEPLARAIFNNAKQMLMQYRAKQKLKADSKVFFRAFPPLDNGKDSDLISQAEFALANGKFTEARKIALHLIDLCLEGSWYYQTYDRFMLQIFVVVGYLGWMSFLSMFIFRHYTAICQYHLNTEFMIYQASNEHIGGDIWLEYVFTSLAAFIATFLFWENSPITYYLYAFFPLFFWCLVLKRRFIIQDVRNWVNSKYTTTHQAIALLGTIFGVELLVISFYYRQMMSVILLCIMIWPLTSNLTQTDKVTVSCWLVACLLGSVYCFLPVDFGSNETLVSISGGFIIGAGVFSVSRDYFHVQPRKLDEYPKVWQSKSRTLMLTMIQIMLICLSIFVVNDAAKSWKEKNGLPVYDMVISWSLLLGAFLQPRYASPHYLARLLSIAMAFAAPYLVLSLYYEGWFYANLSALLLYWFLLEHKLSPTRRQEYLHNLYFSNPEDNEGGRFLRSVMFRDVRSAYIFLFLQLYSFFGTGNFASISSFNPASAYRFVTVFNPFIMGGLLVVKVLIPFILTMSAFNAVHQTLHVPRNSLFFIVIVMTDLMALNFFFLVRDEGSWKEIGTSISHFVIASANSVFLMLIHGICRGFTSEMILPVSRKLQLAAKKHTR